MSKRAQADLETELALARRRIAELERDRAAADRLLAGKAAQAEEARDRSEERLRLAMAATRDGVWDWDVASGEVYYSPGYVRMLGYEPAEVVAGTNFWLEHLHPEDRDLALRINQDCIENRSDTFEAEFRMRAKDGSWRWILGRGNAVARDASGRALRMVGTHSDVTGRHQDREALRESEARFRQLFENAPLAYQSLDGEGRFLEVNRKWQEMLGYTAEEVRGAWLGDYLPPERRERFRRNFPLFKTTGAMDDVELDLVRKDGSLITVSVTGRVQNDDQGRFVRTHCVFQDITERKRTEEELRRSEERARTLAEQIPLSIMRFDREGRVTFVNDWHLKHFARGRVGRSALLGRSIDELPGIASAGLSGRLREVLEGRPVSLDEVFVPRFTGGHSGWISLRAVPEMRDGKMTGGILLREDVTRRRQAQEELRRAKEAAEAADRGKSEFLANMSHEIRTPLNGVLGMLHLLQGTDLDEEQALYADTALESGRHLLDVINDILDLTRLQAGRLVFRSEPFDLAGLLDMVLQSFIASSREKGLTLTAFTDPAIPSPLCGDASRIRQVLFNLAGNALKFTERGQVRVEAWLLGQDPGGLRLYLAVSDTGIGIPESRLADIFDSFTQVDGSLSRKYQGTGLGLSIVRRLVEGMGGTLAVDSAPGEGTTVAVSLRLPRTGDLCDLPVAAEASAGAPVRPLRILVAEDDRINRLLTSRILHKMGHEAVCVESGNELLAAWRREAFDCILMDIQMPGMSGIEATRAIREAERIGNLPRTPVVALTAHAMAGDRERFLAAGMDGYLAKPLEQADLERHLASLAPRRETAG